jgi:hypothetical protein
MLPASHGDCLWLQYGTAKKPRHVLIDGGPAYSYDSLAQRLECRFGPLPPNERRIELLVITHVDSDHIGGILEFLLDEPLGIKIRDVWFNGWRQLPDTAHDVLGPVQGEQVSALLSGRRPWNKAFEGRAAAIGKDGELPCVRLSGGLELTLLSPTMKQLAKLRPKWKKTVEEGGLAAGSAEDALERLREKRHELPPDILGEETPDPHALAMEPFKPDTSVANGSSIALLAEFKEKCVLLAGDALAGVLAESVQRLAEEGGVSRLAIDALKLSHHGGKSNTSTEFLETLRCGTFLFSTDGSRFNHPDPQTVARAILAGEEGSTLAFNYRTPVNTIWDDPALQREFDFRTVFPADDEEGLVVEI